MSGDLGGQFGDLILSAWIGETPDGTESVYLLLATSDDRAPETMPLVAQVFGMDPRPGSVTMTVDPDRLHVTIDRDNWVRLVWTASEVTARLPVEGGTMLRDQRRAAVVVGYQPIPPGLDGIGYVERWPASTVLGLVFVQQREDAP